MFQLTYYIFHQKVLLKHCLNVSNVDHYELIIPLAKHSGHGAKRYMWIPLSGPGNTQFVQKDPVRVVEDVADELIVDGETVLKFVGEE